MKYDNIQLWKHGSGISVAKTHLVDMFFLVTRKIQVKYYNLGHLLWGKKNK